MERTERGKWEPFILSLFCGWHWMWPREQLRSPNILMFPGLDPVTLNSFPCCTSGWAAMNGNPLQLRWKKACLSRPSPGIQKCLCARDACLLHGPLHSSFFSDAKTPRPQATKEGKGLLLFPGYTGLLREVMTGFKQELEVETMEELHLLAHTQARPWLSSFIQPRPSHGESPVSGPPTPANIRFPACMSTGQSVCSDFQVTLGWVKMTIKAKQDISDHSFSPYPVFSKLKGELSRNSFKFLNK